MDERRGRAEALDAAPGMPGMTEAVATTRAAVRRREARAGRSGD